MTYSPCRRARTGRGSCHRAERARLVQKVRKGVRQMSTLLMPPPETKDRVERLPEIRPVERRPLARWPWILAVVAIMLAVFTILIVLPEPVSVEIHDSWMNVPIPTVEIHDSWMNVPSPTVEIHDSWMNSGN